MAESFIDIVINVTESWEDEIDELLWDLAELKVAEEAVDNITIDVDVHGKKQLDALLTRLAAVEALDDNVIDALNNLGNKGGGGMNATNLARMAGADDEDRGLFSGFRLRMESLHNVLAQIVPLLVVFLGAIPALIGAFVSLATAAIAAAGALGALGGFALLGLAEMRGGGDVSEGFQEIVSQVQDDFLDAFLPLARRLAPLMRDALSGLDQLFQAIANRGQSLMLLADVARDLGGSILQELPTILADIARFVHAMMPTFGVLWDTLAQVDVLNAMTHLMMGLLPSLNNLLQVIIQITPIILNMSEGFLQMSIYLLQLAGALFYVASGFGMFGEELGVMISFIFIAISAVSIFNSVILTSLVPSLAKVGQWLIYAISSLTSYSGATFTAALGSATLARAVYTLAGALATVTAGLILIPMLIGKIGGMFMDTTGKIENATEALKNFRQESRRMGTNAYGWQAPEVRRGVFGNTPGAAPTINVEGSSDLRNQAHNMMYRMERPGRGI